MLKTITAQKLKILPNIGIVVSHFNEEITELLYDNAMGRLEELEFLEEHVTVVWVPGAIEIPIATQALIETGNVDAVICLGAVILGETRHFEYVCDQVSQGCQQIAIKLGVPVIFGVLTTDNEEQAMERVQKGSECVDCALQMISVLQQIRAR